MPGRQVVVLGGGPAGLTAARILKGRMPAWTITVFERQAPDRTFGYGVGLSHSSLDRLRAADAGLTDAIESAALAVGTWTVRRDGESLSAKNSHGLGIARAGLLKILQQHAAAAGVQVRMGRQVRLAEVAEADIVIAADGAGSETRAALAGPLGATVSHGELAYMWCGAELALREVILALARTPAGPLAAHVMPYGPGACTFQVDAPAAAVGSWASASPGTGGVALLQREFADLLGPARLHVKRPDWATFPTVTCQRWHSGNIVLLGDAAHTAHYTVGSGTGLAVEDAVELAEALSVGSDPTAAFDAFEAARRPKVARLQRRADRSQRWWTTLEARIGLPLAQLLVSYLTRTGALTLSMVADLNADLIGQCLAQRGLRSSLPPPGELAEAILARPAAVAADQTATIRHETGRPTLADMRKRVEEARDLAGRGVSHVRLAGPPDREALLDRLEIAEQIRAHVKVATIVAGPADYRDDLAVGVLCGRTDLAEFSV